MASTLPELNLDHLQRMTDDTGIVQHATYSVPARRTGYCVDDNARALIVAVHADRVHASTAARALVTTYLSYLHCSQETDGIFRNFMSYDRSLERAVASDDCIGRALWALGVTAALAADEGCRALARDMFAARCRTQRELGPRGTAQAISGREHAGALEPDSAEMRSVLERLADQAHGVLSRYATDDWRWFEATLTYDNALLPLALFAAYGDHRRRRRRCAMPASRSRFSRTLLRRRSPAAGRQHRMAQRGQGEAGRGRASHRRGSLRARVPLRLPGHATDRHYLRRMRESLRLVSRRQSARRAVVRLRDRRLPRRHGVDARSTRTKGAESTICFLMSLLTMLELARR